MKKEKLVVSTGWSTHKDDYVFSFSNNTGLWETDQICFKCYVL